MWSPFTPLASLAAALFSSFQLPFNLSHGAMTRLNYTQLSSFTPYIEFARAAYCDPSKIAGWGCGGLSFLLHLYALAGLLIGTKMPAALFQTSYRLWLEEMGTILSSVSIASFSQGPHFFIELDKRS
jgi:hypothetical protein